MAFLSAPGTDRLNSGVTNSTAAATKAAAPQDEATLYVVQGLPGAAIDVAVDGAFFDPDFFYYREDADVAWRAQLLGWRCIYTPSATAFHVRAVSPENRRRVPPAINMHSVKHRFLLRINNISPNLYWRNCLSITTRDLLVVMCCVLWEHTSLKAFWLLGKNMRRVMAKRRVVQAHRRVDDEYMASWFHYTPVSKQAPRKMVRMLSRSEAART